MIVALIGAIWGEEWLRRNGYPVGLLVGPIMAAIGAESARELAKVFRARRIEASTAVLTLAVWTGLAVSGLAMTGESGRGERSGAVVSTAAMGVMLLSMVYYARRRSAQGVVAAVATTLFAFVYVGLMGGFVLALLREFGGWTLLAMVAVTKSGDIGAYFTGTTIGRHKLIRWLSPGKTWEGLAGGVALAAGVGAMAAGMSGQGESGPLVEVWVGAMLGGMLGLVGQGGDLVASMLKRDAGMKDYSRALPGFGGALDIVDSVLLMAPVGYWLMRWLTAMGWMGGIG